MPFVIIKEKTEGSRIALGLRAAMAVGQVPLYLDVPFNREVAGEVGFPFEKNPDALARLIDQLTTPETFTSQVHLSHRLNEINEINKTNQTNQTNQINEINEINQTNQIAKQIIKERYSWHSVISSYEKLLIRVKGEK